MTEQFAFVDESLRSGRYLLGCVVVDVSAAGPMRRDVRKLLLANERRLHIRKSDRHSVFGSWARSRDGTWMLGSTSVAIATRSVQRKHASSAWRG